MSSTIGKKRMRSVPRRWPMLSTGKRSSSTMVARTESGHHLLTIDGYTSSTEFHPTGVYTRSPPFTVGGHRWCIYYFPNGVNAAYVDHVSLGLVIDQDVQAPVKAKHIFHLAGKAEAAEQTAWWLWEKVRYGGRGCGMVCAAFIKRVDLESSEHLRNDSFTIRCDITVVKEPRVKDTTPLVSVPPSNIIRHLAELLETGMGSDVVFQVAGETIAAHRCLLTARLPVFAAELLVLPVKEVTGGVVHIADIEAEVFKALLYFAYTDSLPETISKENQSVMCQHLLVVADRYGMERLKLICEEKLCECIDVGTVATILPLAEQRRCHRLKKSCFDFLATSESLAIDDFQHLRRSSCPSTMSSSIRNKQSSSSVMVSRTETGHHLLTIYGYFDTVDSYPTGERIRSHHFTAGGHRWCIDYYPNGMGPAYAHHVSLGLSLDEDVETPVKAKRAFYLADEVEEEAEQVEQLSCQKVICHTRGSGSVYGVFIKRVDLERSEHLRNDSFTIRCDIAVIKEPLLKDTTSLVPVPPSNIIRHLGELLETKNDADVVFEVGGETIAAHRCLLAARSPVFAAELLGPMKEGNVAAGGVVRVGDIETEAFKALLHFAYTDMLPETISKEDENVACQHLLVAADRYDMERLKLMCEEKLCEHIGIGTVATILALAEQHRCEELKKSCFDFLTTWTNLRDAMATADFEHLSTSCPSIMSELRAMSLPH